MTRGSIPPPPSDLRGTGVRPTDDGDYQRPTPMRPRRPPTPGAMPEVTFRPPPPASGPFATFLAQQQANRDVVTNARDLRTDARVRIDNVWSGMAESTKEEFGRSPSREVWDQADQSAVVALNQARDLEAAYLALAGTPGASPSAVDAAFDRFADGVLRWLNGVTKRWPSARTYQKQQAAAADWWNQ